MEKLTFVLDVGSGSTKLLAGYVLDGQPIVVEALSASCPLQLQGGRIANIEKSTEIVKKLLVQMQKSLNMAMMSESMKKIEHADFIALMSKDQTRDDQVHLKVAKNRCGRDNVAIDFNVNFNHYKFLSGLKAANDRRPDVTTDQQFQIDSINASVKAEVKKPFLGMKEEPTVDLGVF